jgi:hypothetical protein
MLRTREVALPLLSRCTESRVARIASTGSDALPYRAAHLAAQSDNLAPGAAERVAHEVGAEPRAHTNVRPHQPHCPELRPLQERHARLDLGAPTRFAHHLELAAHGDGALPHRS